MSNADYKISPYSASFNTFVIADAARSEIDTVIDYTDFNFDTTDAIQVGMAVLWEEEFCRVEAVGIRTFTVKRGCADTIPAPHAAGSRLWVIDNPGTDRAEHAAGETVSIKVQPITVGGGTFPIANAPPMEIDFDWRFFRPYPPAYMMANTARWYSGAAINDTTGGMNLTWRHRDRVLQADQLVGHDEPSIGPEPGTTYTLLIRNASGTVLRTEVGIIGEAFLYQQSKALHDFGSPGAPVGGSAHFYSERAGMISRQQYAIPLLVEPSAAPIESVWQAFAQIAFETPYILNARSAVTPDSVSTSAFAARPADRMSDNFDLIHHWSEVVDTGEVDEEDNPIYETVHHYDTILADKVYSGWLTTDFALPELETTMTIRSSSLFDGVPLAALVGKLGLIENELVAITAHDQTAGTITIGRGVGDTVPARHIAGTRMWIVEPANIDANNRGGAVDWRFAPGVFGTPVNAATLPPVVATYNSRAARPYNVGQLVVAGRPWFEEAVMQDGQALAITWAWRNRVTQADTARDHAYPTVPPEAGTQAILQFFYEQPPGVNHVLRSVTIDPVVVADETLDGAYSYPYATATTDGNIAGAAQGVCGTTIIKCRLFTVVGGLQSLQHYDIPIRVPSFPC